MDPTIIMCRKEVRPPKAAFAKQCTEPVSNISASPHLPSILRNPVFFRINPCFDSLYHAEGQIEKYFSKIFKKTSCQKKFLLTNNPKGLFHNPMGLLPMCRRSRAIQPPPYSIRNAKIVFAVTPILLVYPFIRKHFTNGVMIVAIKG